MLVLTDTTTKWRLLHYYIELSSTPYLTMAMNTSHIQSTSGAFLAAADGHGKCCGGRRHQCKGELFKVYRVEGEAWVYIDKPVVACDEVVACAQLLRSWWANPEGKKNRIQDGERRSL